MDISKIAKEIDWQKKWRVQNFSILSSSLLHSSYSKNTKARFGKFLSRQFYIYKENAITCYTSKNEEVDFGKQVAKIIDGQIKNAQKLSTELVSRDKELHKLIKKQKLKNIYTLEDYKNFKKLHQESFPIFIAVNRSPDYITGKNSKKIIKILTKARLNSEQLFVDADKFLQEIAEKLINNKKINPNILTIQEFENIIKINKYPTIPSLRKRTPICGMYSFKNKYYIFSSLDTEKFENIISKKYGLTVGEVKGQVASVGFVKGMVRIISNPNGVKNFKNGNILIAEMTRPDFLPLMKKAGAIVTDAGGLLCHAAIVARELNKPCIISTHTATKAFKDGDFVEVDANAGVVRLI